MTNILKEAGNAIAKALGAAAKPCLPHGERAAAHAAQIQAHRVKHEESEASAQSARSLATSACEREVAEIERGRVAEIGAEGARIADLFATRQEKDAMRSEASQRINEAARIRCVAAEAKRNERLAAIQAEAGPVVKACERCIAEAEEAYATGEREVRKRLLADFHAVVTPALEAWIEVPAKAKAEPIARAFWDHNVRAKRELGAELMPELIVIAFANVLGADKPGIVDRLGGDLDYTVPVMSASQQFVNTLELELVEINKSLHLLNEAVEELVAKASEPNERLVRRYAVRKTCATRGDLVHAMQAFDKEEEIKQRASFAASHRPTKLVTFKGDHSVIEYEDGGVEESHHDGGNGRRVVVKRAGGLPAASA